MYILQYTLLPFDENPRCEQSSDAVYVKTSFFFLMLPGFMLNHFQGTKTQNCINITLQRELL